MNVISKLKREFIYGKRDVEAMMGFNKRFFKEARGARMLIYHGICLTDHTRFNPIFLTQQIFEEHLKFYKEYFNLVSLDDFYAGKFSSERFNVCITFDDGYANNYKYVLPLMEKYEVPICFFITAIRNAGYDILWNDFLGVVTRYGPSQLAYDNLVFRKDKFGRYASIQSGTTLVDHLKEDGFEGKEAMMKELKHLFPSGKQEEDYWLQMTADEIRTLAASAFTTVGSHGYFHNSMDKLPIQEAVEEMRASRNYLESVTGKEITAFAFPYGNYSRRMIEEAKKLGYDKFLAMDFFYPEDKHDPSLRERFTVNPFISVNNQMHAIVTGKYA